MANTISDELNRLIQAKAGIKSALEEKGLTIGDSSTLDEFPGLIQEMEVGGGGGTDTSVLIDMIERDLTSIEIPYGITTIGAHAFQGCDNLTDVSIPNTVTVIGQDAFNGCKNLKDVKLPNSLITIEQSGFNNTSTFRNIIVPDSVITLGNSVFGENPAIRLLVLGSGVQSCGQYIISRYPNATANLNIISLAETPPTISTNSTRPSFGISGSQKIYVHNTDVDAYKNAWTMYSSVIYPLAAMDYDASTYTVTASGRDNLELYVDASLCDSSVYTFTQGTEDSSHVITVKSVDPSLGVLDTYTTEVLVEAAAPSYYAAAPTYTVGTPTYTYYQPSNCYKINLPVTFINAELQGYEGQYTTHRLLGSADDNYGNWYSDFSPVDDPDANPTKFYRYYYQNDTNTTLHLHNSVVVVYKDGNDNELYRTDSMNLDSSIVTDYWFKEQLSAPTIDIGQDRTEYFGEITSTDANADTIYYKINDGDWETVAGNTANIENGGISYGDIVYAYSADSNGNYLDSEIVSATPE